jgi:hypothetical protein
VYFAALFRRFPTIWARRVRSPSIHIGSDGRSTVRKWPAESIHGRPADLDGRSDDFRQLDPLLAKFDFALVYAGNIEQIVDEPR